MLVVLNTEKLSKLYPEISISNLLYYAKQDIDIIEMFNKDEGLKDNIAEVKALVDCLEIRNSEIDQTVENILKLTKKEVSLC